MVMMNKDWRLFNQINFLFRRKLKKDYFIPSPEKDHEHCAFCWEKFGEQKDMIHSGYRTEDGKHWICEQCFEDFKSTFQWIVD